MRCSIYLHAALIRNIRFCWFSLYLFCCAASAQFQSIHRWIKKFSVQIEQKRRLICWQEGISVGPNHLILLLFLFIFWMVRSTCGCNQFKLVVQLIAVLRYFFGELPIVRQGINLHLKRRRNTNRKSRE